MRKPFIAGNWKMHTTINEARELVAGIKKELSGFEKAKIAVFPPFTVLDNVSQTLKDTDIKLGAQNMFWEEKGAFTGEVSSVMLKDCGCEYVIIGHSKMVSTNRNCSSNIPRKFFPVPITKNSKKFPTRKK